MIEGRCREKLKRQLGFFPSTNIVIGNMIGAGIFATSGLLMKELHDPVLMVVLWVVGGIIFIGTFSTEEIARIKNYTPKGRFS